MLVGKHVKWILGGFNVATYHLLDSTVAAFLAEKAAKLEASFEADVATFIGPIHDALLREFRDFIEHLANRPGRRRRLAMFLQTDGGSAEAAEKMVEIMRHHYDELWFVVPDAAMSAGTILVMSGDRIWMDYSSSLGPIDPQVQVHDGDSHQFVPALGFLDKMNELITKSLAGTLSDAEFALLSRQHLGTIRAYEQARDLSIHFLKKWLVEYKFKDWTVHRTDPLKKGQPVTVEEKQERAEEIAKKLNDNKLWLSHGRYLGMKTLTNDLRLEIDDFQADAEKHSLIREYYDTLFEYAQRMKQVYCMHSAYRSTL